VSISERSMETDRGPMSWLEAGAGWPVILLHAFPLDAGIWRPQLDAVPQGWRFIAPDLRGFGRFLPPEGGSHAITQEDSWLPPLGGRAITMDDYAADVFCLMDSLKLDDAVIGGLSMGGYVAFAMFRQSPRRFTGMILADTRSQADTPAAREARLQLRELLRTGGPGAVATQMLPKLFSAAAPPGVVSRTRAMIESASPAAIDAAVVAMMDRPDSTPGLANIACGALVVVGEKDEITPVADAETMQRAIPRSALCVIAGAGHLSSLEQPEVFSRALSDFLIAPL
jgi:3-oxoadipate enol-lactonase